MISTSVLTVVFFFFLLDKPQLSFPTNSASVRVNRVKRRALFLTLHAAALCLLVQTMRRGSDDAAGACGVAVRTVSRHCYVPAAARGCNADGTLRHLNAAACATATSTPLLPSLSVGNLTFSSTRLSLPVATSFYQLFMCQQIIKYYF